MVAEALNVLRYFTVFKNNCNQTIVYSSLQSCPLLLCILTILPVVLWHICTEELSDDNS